VGTWPVVQHFNQLPVNRKFESQLVTPLLVLLSGMIDVVTAVIKLHSLI